MSLNINSEVFITCALTGSGSTQEKSKFVPRSPKEIADDAILAAKSGASIVHCHVRDPNTGVPSRKLEYYKEVTDRIRNSNTDVVLNLTAGMGGDMVFGPTSNPLKLGKGTDMISAEERVEHIASCLPEICTLDCGTMNFAEADYVMTNTPGMLEKMGKLITDFGVTPEIEAFDTGHLWYAKQLVSNGILKNPALVQLCMGIPWTAEANTENMLALRNMLPDGSIWAGFGISRMQMPMVAQAMILGGNVRVGLEDNLYLERGVLASNAQLVERAVEIIERLGGKILSPAQTREKLGLKKLL